MQRVDDWALWDDFRFIIGKRTLVVVRLRLSGVEPPVGAGCASPSGGAQKVVEDGERRDRLGYDEDTE